ncbi:hypothetical protein KUCAC02_023926 [Chaenocephalus aceratus]|uniref:Uncharacterized protein n=1 Tax=Chaenocephalus aceratus TaxID=36190 RepID=A0ACB9WHW3_CHAAC|nr:hypothetical protein KUCAC02_023926 [Chaenocephalus aceratus]
MAHNESLVALNGTQISYIGHDCKDIPDFLGDTYGLFARRLDLSFNQLRSLAGLEMFIELEELIVDNNLLGNDLLLPREHCVLQKRGEELAVTELHTGRVFEPQGPLVESDFRVNITDVFYFERRSSVRLKLH